MLRLTLTPLAALAMAAVAVPHLLQAGFNPETGSYVFQRYTPKQYGASPQNWSIAQDRRGVMYFANEEGVLEFDGSSWRSIRLNRNAAARSLAVDAQGTVYVGGIGEFGFLKADRSGTMRFVSLLDRVSPADREFADIWRILPSSDGVYFSAYNRLFRLNPDSLIQAWRPISNFGRAFQAGNTVYVKTREEGLLRVSGERLSPFPGGALFAKVSVTTGTSLPGRGDEGLIGTAGALYRVTSAGVAPFPTGADSWFGKNVVNTVKVLPGGEIVVGSRRGGVAFVSPDGTLDRVVTKADGLPDDLVEAIYTDDQEGIWLAGNNGLIRFNPGLSAFGANLGIEGDVECMDRQGGVLYAGSTTGIFALKTSVSGYPRFRRIAGVDSRVLALLPRDRDLLAATNSGIFLISGEKAEKIFASDQVVYDLSSSQRDPEVVYAAARAHVFVLRRNGKAWLNAATFDAPAEEFRSVLEDSDGKVWATTTGNVWRLDFGAKPARSEKFSAAQSLPAGWIIVRRLQGHITFATSKGLRRFVESTGRFGPDIALGTDYFNGSRDVFNIFENARGDVWVTGQNYHDLLRRGSTGYQRVPSPLLAAGIQEIYGMSLDPDGTAWATGADWVLHRWEPALAGNPDNSFGVTTRRIEATGEKSPLYDGGGPFQFARLPWRLNALRFEFAAPFYEDPPSVEYQVELEGSDPGWSSWSHETRRDYTHLSEGSYRFRVRARSPHGATSEDSSISFGILPPWYRTWWAWLIWLSCLAVAVWALVQWRTRKLVQDKHRLETIVEERTVEIRNQERRTHSLLLNILPEKVADELKTTGAVKPMSFDDVTVCFTDFVGFTLSSEKMHAGKLVGALNEYFTRFDEIVAHYSLEKLKTIGDSYMFAGGLPAPRASHAVDAVLAAMEMVDVVKELATKIDSTGWNIRVGLHSGPVVAGVVGTRKFAFDIWGDTVNFASRMESSGVPGRVNLSERTFELMRGLIRCEPRGMVKIKEGRQLPMYLAAGLEDRCAERYEREFGAAPKPSLARTPQISGPDLSAQDSDFPDATARRTQSADPTVPAPR